MKTDAFDYTGRVVIITGASRGLGKAIAIGFAKAGSDIVVSSRSADACNSVVQEIEAMGGRAVSAPCHVGRWNDLPSLIDAALDAFGRIDTLVNNAGIAPVVDGSAAVTEDFFDKTFAVNTKGPFRLSALARPHLAENRGSIINVTSIAAERPDPAYPIYAAAKGATNILTRAQAMEFGPEVRVNAIMAGPFWTDISKSWREDYEQNAPSALRRIGQPEEIVTSALYLASPASSYVSGTIIRLDGGIIV
jgi:NAD(P)-dependent dehydrogenase (short-subunit alcohol dehydrogenase family)